MPEEPSIIWLFTCTCMTGNAGMAHTNILVHTARNSPIRSFHIHTCLVQGGEGP